MLNKRIASRYLKPLMPIPTAMAKSGKPLTGIRCVLFDIYGTLLISASGDISISQNQKQPNDKIEHLIKKYGIRSDPQSLMTALNQTIASTHEGKRKNGILFPEVEIDRIWMQVLNTPRRNFIRKFALEYELSVNPVYPMPHSEELLQACRSRKIIMGLISNAQFYTEYLLKWFLGAAPEDLGFNPELIILSYQTGYAKPSPELFRKAAAALAEMNIQPRAALFAGNDMLNDILPAKQAGFKTALFAGDNRSLRLRKDDPRCRSLSADIVLTDLIQLLDFI